MYDEQQQYRQKPENREQQKLKSLKRNRDKTGSHVLIVDHLHNDSKLISDENQWKSKKPRTKKERVGSSKISFKHSTSLYDSVEPYAEAIAHMKDIIYKTAAFRQVNIPLLKIMDQMNFMKTIITFYF